MLTPVGATTIFINKSSKVDTSCSGRKLHPAGPIESLESSLISTRCWLYKSIHERIMKDEPLIEKEELYKIVEKAGNEALKTEKFQKMGAQDKISNIFEQFQIAFEGAYQFFMKLAKQMQIDSLPNIIQEECNQFLNDFKEENLNLLCNKYKYNNTWIESNEKLCEITKEILNTL
ncbi:unnamed protein product [Rhizophagus irregularis]|nr:unnamed protein product [Rhizophagus irregularis]